MKTIPLVAAAALFLAPAAARAVDPIFSGPQLGEKLPNFGMRGVYDDDAGKMFDLVEMADGGPVCIVFMHKLTRPSAGVMRTVMRYAATRKQDGLTSGVVWLSDDATAAANRMKQARHALADMVPTGISVDGAEGPGSYGLNRQMSLTVLVGNEGKVTANFPLIQPSIQADVPRVLKAIVDQLGGGKVPTLAELGAVRYTNQKRPAMKTRKSGAAENQNEQDPALRGLLGPVIQKEATPQQVDKAAAAVEAYAAENRRAGRQITGIAQRIINAGRLENYGTPAAQAYLRKWAKGEFSTDDDDAQKDKTGSP